MEVDWAYDKEGEMSTRRTGLEAETEEDQKLGRGRNSERGQMVE
jgi:hypothetical protein